MFSIGAYYFFIAVTTLSMKINPENQKILKIRIVDPL